MGWVRDKALGGKLPGRTLHPSGFRPSGQIDAEGICYPAFGDRLLGTSVERKQP